MSQDPKEDYFSDGITEDIITELSRFSELFVIARNSSFQYKGKSPDIRQVGRDLGVRYVLEGSIRRGGDRVRITAQLIDATTGGHRWAERYDRKLEDVFALQDEVARTIVTTLAVHVNKAETERTLLKPPATWQAYDYYMRAVDVYDFYWTSFDVQDVYKARSLLEQSLSVDCNYARAAGLLSCTYLTAWLNPLDNDFRNPSALARASALARRAVELEPTSPMAHSYLGDVLSCQRQFDASIAEFERALTLNPNFTHLHSAMVLIMAGEHERALMVLERHTRFDPFYTPQAPYWRGTALYLLKRYSEALPPLLETMLRAPNFTICRLFLAAVYAQLGRLDEARAEANQILTKWPAYKINPTRILYKEPSDIQNLLDGLRKAGLPE